jgi:hypothetical protein
MQICTLWQNLSPEDFRKKSMGLTARVWKTLSTIFWKGSLTFWV